MTPDHPQAQPFLKWAGGKGQLLAQYEAFFPSTPMRRYFEPFVGSGAVFFYLRAKGRFERYYLSEINVELVNCYRVARDDVEGLIRLLAAHRECHSADYYYAVRALDRDPGWCYAADAARAARMIYLNKTCYNGLWRVNSQGYFNVPMGRYKTPDILNADRLRAASAALQGVELSMMDFEGVIRLAGPGDFVYLDPPYFPLTKTAYFTSYAADSFGEYEHRKLALVFAELDRLGARVMLSNSDTLLVREIYRDFRTETVLARRAINSATGKRGVITEIVVMNY